jgi:hypothetical protein
MLGCGGCIFLWVDMSLRFASKGRLLEDAMDIIDVFQTDWDIDDQIKSILTASNDENSAVTYVTDCKRTPYPRSPSTPSQTIYSFGTSENEDDAVPLSVLPLISFDRNPPFLYW